MIEVERAKQILAENLYMTVATVDENGEPWVTPLRMVFDDEYNLYWHSGAKARHSQLIEKNNKVAIVVFDSTVSEGQGKGVYIKATVIKITDPDELRKIIPMYYAKKNKSPRDVEKFLSDSGRRFYKAIPEKFWVNLDAVDERVEVDLRA